MSDVIALERPMGNANVWRDYLQLSKSRIVMMVLITTAAGYFFAAPRVDWALLINTLVGTALVAAGTNALNQYVERDHDAKMRRTRLRPLPDGRITPRAALLFSVAISIIGTVYLAVAVNWLTAALGALTLTTYIFIYTPLKRVSTICTLIGAIPGAIPPLMGWTAATGSLAAGGWIIFAILFFWQLPHFMAISWMYRDDYARGGFAMLAVRDDDGRATAQQAVLYSFALLTVSVLPPFFGLSTYLYLIGAIAAGAALTVASFAFLASRTPAHARRLFMASNIYLIVMMALLVLA
jgi:protoheme IX farnesyltransferase